VWAVRGGQWTKSHWRSAFLALDEQQALACEDKEILLRRLGVVETAQAARLEHGEGHAKLWETLLLEIRTLAQDAPVRLEDTGGSEGLVAHPCCLAHVDDEPAGAHRGEPRANVVEAGFLAHRTNLIARSRDIRKHWLRRGPPLHGNSQGIEQVGLRFAA
jgi:hypothetical protein